MIFERLIFHFQRNGVTDTSEYPDPEETSLVRILVPNNTGKTTIRSGANSIRRIRNATAADFHHGTVEGHQGIFHHTRVKTFSQ